MTKKNGTKRSLLMSAVALVLCFSMLVGSTFAWFTDSVTSSGNIIASGKLDVEMSWAKGTDDPNAAATVWTDASTGTIFNYDKWEPGYVDAKHIQIKNVGNLAFKYKLNIVPNGTVSELANVIDVYFGDPAAAATRDLTGMSLVGTLAQMIADPDGAAYGTLLADDGQDTKTVTIALKMQESAGNQYMDMSIGSAFAVELVATQQTNESDSFDNQYDKDAEYANASEPKDLPTAGSTATEITLETEVVEVVVPETVVAGLMAVPEVTSVAIEHTMPVVDTVNNKVTFDSVELVDQDGNVIDLEAMGNSDDLTVTLPVEGFEDGEEVAVYHDDELVATATVANGEVTYTVKHFCKVVISGPTEIADAAALKEALEAGGFVTLSSDVIISESLPVTKDTVLDLNGKNIGTDGSTTGSPLYLQGGKLTVKNGTLDLDGSHTNVNGTFSVAIGYDAQTELVVENVNFTGKTAINGTFATDGPLKVTVSDCTMDVTSLGIAVSANSTEAIATINNCNIDADEYAIFASQGSKITINGGTYKSAGKVITSMYDNTVVTINGGTFDGELWVTSGGSLVIKGGTFTADPTAYVADGYIAVANNDGTWTVVKGFVVSTADELKDAIEKGGTIVLAGNIVLDSTLLVKKDVVIDLNGKKMTAPSSGNMFQSQSNAAPSMIITSSKDEAEINVTGGDTSVLLGYGSTVINNVTINVTGCDNKSPNPFNVYGDLTLGEGTIVNVDYLGTALISNNGKVAIVIDGAEINIGTFKTNGTAIITLNQASTLEMKNTAMKIDNFVLSPFGGDSLVSKVDGVTIENCTFNVTDSNVASCTFVANDGKYRLVQN